jgi:hypothetical protein
VLRKSSLAKSYIGNKTTDLGLGLGTGSMVMGLARDFTVIDPKLACSTDKARNNKSLRRKAP